MKSKTFFLDNTRLDEVGSELILTMDDYFDKLYEKYISKGYNPREITQILNQSVTLIETKHSVKFSNEYDKKMRLEKLDDNLKENRKKKTASSK